MKIGKFNISKKNLIVIGIAVVFIIGCIFIVNKGDNKGLFYNPDKNIKIVKSEASKIELEDYQTNEFSIKKPKDGKLIQLVIIFTIRLEYIILIIQSINFSSI